MSIILANDKIEVQDIEFIEMEPWMRIVLQLQNARPADFFSHEKLVEMMGRKKITHSYRTNMYKAEQELINRGVFINNVHGKGYKILTPDEVAVKIQKMAAKSDRSISKAAKMLRLAPVEKMSSKAVEICSVVSEFIKSKKFLMEGGVVGFLDKSPRQERTIRTN